MQLNESIAIVTGADRGLGRQIASQLLSRGARRVYAAALEESSLAPLVAIAPDRVAPLTLDITDPTLVQAAAQRAGDVNMLINNAGIMTFGRPGAIDPSAAQHDLVTNVIGPLRMLQAFIPVIEANGGGAIVNILSLLALAPYLDMSAYCASKAAGYALTMALRAELSGRPVEVIGVYPGAMNTDMLTGVDIDKADPAEVAAAIADGIEAGTPDITPDPFSAAGYATWLAGPKALQQQLLG